MTRTLQVVIWLCVIQMLGRGTDLVFSNPYKHSQALDLGGVEELIWGVACLVSAGVVLVGLLFKKSPVLVNGCLMAFATYVMFAWYVVDETMLLWPPDNWRIFLDHACRGALWLVLALCVSFRQGIIRIRARKREEAVDGLGTVDK